MLSEDSRLFLRYNFSPLDLDRAEEWAETGAMICKAGRPAIEMAVHEFVDTYMETIPKMAPLKENIDANWEEAVQYAAGLLGMA